MGRRKIEIKAIKEDRNRSVTFVKRKGGLFKKAHELSVLCSVDVAVIIFGHNKKVFEYSSYDMGETTDRYQMCGPPHEHKGPEDFSGKRDDDDEEDDNTPAPDEPAPVHSAPMPQPHPGFQHVNHAPSASPPVNAAQLARHGTPQPHGSRPSSRNHIRRVSSNLGPQHRVTPPPANTFTYAHNSSAHNPHLNQPRQGQFAQYGPARPQSVPHNVPPAAQHQTPPPHVQHVAHTQAPVAFTQPPMPMAQTYVEHSRSSVPPSFAPERGRAVSYTEAPSEQAQPVKTEENPPPKAVSSKSRSIFTPIDDRGSVLARYFPVGPAEPPRVDSRQVPFTQSPVQAPQPPQTGARRLSITALTEPQSTTSIPAIAEATPRPTSGQLSKRPQLKVQIPSENSDRGSATAESSSRDSAGNKVTTPAKHDGNQSGVVLPPPSPSASAILSAGATGPPNPFARPPPPTTTAVQSSVNTTSYASNNNIETPISALPSRFVSDALLPSPSSFFPEWGFGRSSGPDSNMLPSPLTFPTPAVASGPGFAREDESERERKRKASEGELSQDGGNKKSKT